jgi:hypothetical protein
MTRETEMGRWAGRVRLSDVCVGRWVVGIGEVRGRRVHYTYHTAR